MNILVNIFSIVVVKFTGGGEELIRVTDSRTGRVDSEIHNDALKEAEPMKASLFATHIHLDTLVQSHAEIENSSSSSCTISHIECIFVKEAEPMKKASMFATRAHLYALDQNRAEIENSPTVTCTIHHEKQLWTFEESKVGLLW